MANNTLKSLETLIKIEKEHVENLLKKRQMLARDMLLMHEEKKLTEERLKKENTFAGDVASFMTLPHFAKASRDKIQVIQDKLLYAQHQEVLLQSELSNMYARMKTYEVLKRMKKEGLEKLRLKREQKDLDEVGLHKFLFNRI
ncbi:MAG: flagellar FliJ family protein [Alphaproteobacteria bacterium]|nr:flagellar FliJ family protein [Alphaproteobacteria bacterium]